MAETVFYNPAPSDIAVLSVILPDGSVTTYQLKGSEKLGRKADGKNNIVIPSPIVSGSHGEIVLMKDEYFYRDLDSSNGTYVNDRLYGKKAEDGAKIARLSDGAVISIDIPSGGKRHSAAVTAIFSQSLSADVIWNKVPLKDDIAEICIGRADDSDLKFTDMAISEKHASFFHAKNGWAVIDHDSTNGVYVNNKRIVMPVYLSDGDVVRMSDTYFVFMGDHILMSMCDVAVDDSKVETGGTSIALPKDNGGNNAVSLRNSSRNSNDLVIKIIERSVIQRFKKMMLLQDINISVSNGDMVLILGGSGAGKTTFINAVMGYEKAKGKIVYRDTDIYSEYEQMKYEIGFVPQQDLLRGSDTVYDTLANAAYMKMPRHVSEEEREKRIDSVLEELGLTREKFSLVTKLSGGQRKRLSIAVEYIADPSLFFLDEPDSGIDDIMGRGLMENLRKIADRGKIVMVITHSPERAADLFDKVIVLAKSTKDNCGHLAFYGSPKEAFDFFEVSAFRDIVRRINRPDENGEGLSDHYIEKYSRMMEGK